MSCGSARYRLRTNSHLLQMTTRLRARYAPFSLCRSNRPLSSGEVEWQDIVCQLIQTATEDEHTHQDQDRTSDERDGTRVPADAAHERAVTIKQEPDQEKRQTQYEYIGNQEDTASHERLTYAIKH